MADLNRNDVAAGIHAALDSFEDPALTAAVLDAIDNIPDTDLTVEKVVAIAKAVTTERVAIRIEELRRQTREAETLAAALHDQNERHRRFCEAVAEAFQSGRLAHGGDQEH